MIRSICGLLCLLLPSCAGLSVGAEITVAVYGSNGWEPQTELVLQIGDQTFSGFGGVASGRAGGSVDVYVIERETCESRIGFRAEPGSRHLIRLASGSVESRELVADEPLDAGPALEPVPPLDCPER